MKLVELLEKNGNYGFGNDPGTDKESQHKYVTTFYEEAFSPYKKKEVTILELGINGGGSLLLWRDYFQQGKIIGLDIADSLSRPKEEYTGMDIRFKNGYDTSVIDSLPSVDIAIDDGPHTLSTQIEFIIYYLPKIRPGGLLVIEDIPSIDHIPYFEKLALKDPSVREMKVYDTSKQYSQYDNIIYAVWKK